MPRLMVSSDKFQLVVLVDLLGTAHLAPVAGGTQAVLGLHGEGPVLRDGEGMLGAFLHALAAALKAIEIINRGYDKKELLLTVKQKETLDDCQKKIEALPTETEKFVEHCHKEYDGNVPNYNIKNYGL